MDNVINVNGVVLTEQSLNMIEQLQMDDNHEILVINKEISEIIIDLYELENYTASNEEFNQALHKTEIVKKLHFINWHFSQLMKPRKLGK